MPSALTRRMVSNNSLTISGASPSEGSSSKQQPRLRHQGAGDGHHLLLAAGEHAGRAFQIGAQHREQPADPIERGGAVAALAAGNRLPNSRFSRTVMPVNRRRPSGTMAMPSPQKRCAGNRVRSLVIERQRAGRDTIQAGDRC